MKQIYLAPSGWMVKNVPWAQLELATDKGNFSKDFVFYFTFGII
jgi:hypothetical protein